MRRFLRIAIVLLIAPLIGFALAVPAIAGGPTSVALVNGGTGQATALHTASRSYQELTHAIGEMDDPARTLDKAPSSAATGGQEGRQVTATWLIHDVQVWRVDRIHLDTRDGRPLIQRFEGDLSDADTVAKGIWLRAADAEGLRELLTRLKVDGKATDGDSQSAPDYPVAQGGDGTTPSKSPAPERTAAPDPDAATGWWWAVPGAAAGALLVWVSLRARPRTGVEGRSRWELLDASEPDEPDEPEPGEQPLHEQPPAQPTGSPGAG